MSAAPKAEGAAPSRAGRNAALTLADVGSTMMEVALKNGVSSIVAECGGSCSCATCHVYVDEAWVDRLAPPSDEEADQLDAAYDFLLRTRNELHYQTNRATDVLSRGLQPTVAHRLGYSERSPAKRIERFMRDLYIHMRHLHLITRTLEERLALLPGSSRLKSSSPA